MKGMLYLVATPIGNVDDMTIRGLSVLRTVDLIVCEERREGERLLRHFQIEKPLETLNEHNETAATHTILQVLRGGKSVAVISDCGTPVFSDPGQMLVRKAVEEEIRVVPVPGASSLLPALTVSGFPIEQFLYYGWLSPKKERRRADLRQLQQEQRTIVLMETPYRLSSLLRDLADTFGESRRCCLAFNLTLPDEHIYHDTAAGLYRALGAKDLKGEFVVVIDGKKIDRGR
jgi:16S rRNA (cytidine1402-2'-O)-methyltransferase